MTVSNGDRELARVEAATALVHKRWDRYAFKDTDEKVALKALDVIEVSDSPWMHAMIDALVENAYWGPRPRVSPTKLGEFIGEANAGGMAVPWRGLQDYLRECGIEVTDDRTE